MLAIAMGSTMATRRSLLMTPRGNLKGAGFTSVILFRGVVVQVDPFEIVQILKPGYHISGSRVKTRRFQARGQLNSTCTAPPWHLGRGDGAEVLLDHGLHLAVAAQVAFESKL
jgi:hypothetical protein